MEKPSTFQLDLDLSESIQLQVLLAASILVFLLCVQKFLLSWVSFSSLPCHVGDVILPCAMAVKDAEKNPGSFSNRRGTNHAVSGGWLLGFRSGFLVHAGTTRTCLNEELVEELFSTAQLAAEDLWRLNEAIFNVPEDDAMNSQLSNRCLTHKSFSRF